MPDWPPNNVDLYNATIGGTAPSGSALSTGDISQMVKWLTTNGPTTFPKLPLLGTAAGNNPLFSTPGVIARLDRGGTVLTSGMNSAATATQLAFTFDATARMPLGANITAQNSSLLIDLPYANTGAGPGGKMPAWTNSAGVLVPSSSTTLFAGEFYGKWPTASAARSDNRFWGLSVSGSSLSAASQGFGFYRKTTSGWTVVSSDGTVSETSEASDTSDSSLHLFRLEWDGTANVRLYVDGTLKVTKTTNPPLETGAYSLKKLQCSSATGDASNLWYIAAMLGYFA